MNKVLSCNSWERRPEIFLNFWPIDNFLEDKKPDVFQCRQRTFESKKMRMSVLFLSRFSWSLKVNKILTRNFKISKIVLAFDRKQSRTKKFKHFCYQHKNFFLSLEDKFEA